MMNNKIETGLLISEIIKCNTDRDYGRNFIKYLIRKILEEGFFRSSLFRQLVRLADAQTNAPTDTDTTYTVHE